MYNVAFDMKPLNLAVEYAKRALMLDDRNSFAYCTLAEACAATQDDEGFYANIELAMRHGFPVWEQMDDEMVYERYLTQPRFQSMLTQYRARQA